ncbi:MAG: hypothetical protein ETSY1_27525 [Candidatus Entotheonella factor]|uniref:Uncharacterized protein n=1 Tax=Entotheonella factor TaxID=1429438 RepID=W4LFV3_ENTF1|nr:hypothetical protein [Candidatus Entotheonella palauensis]ETW96221.1 MAG: hypothetical protein ETSY1_27525 [Candidatus Entotheonella factor]
MTERCQSNSKFRQDMRNLNHAVHRQMWAFIAVVAGLACEQTDLNVSDEQGFHVLRARL